METKQISRKRKQPPSNPLTGIFTRQKSRMFLHHNRSGKSRLDPLRKSDSFPLLYNRCKVKSGMGESRKSPRNEADDDESIHLVSIMDLRARRIFSKPQSKQLSSLSEVESGKDLNPSSYAELNDEKSCENPNSLLAGEFDSKDDVVGEGLNHGSTNSSLFAKCDSRGVDFQGDDSAGEITNLSAEEGCDTVVDFTKEESKGENPSSLVASTGASSEKGEISGCSDGREILDDEKEEKFDVGLNCIGQIADSLSPNLRDKDLKLLNGLNCEGFTEESVQTTPSDAVIHVKRYEDGSSLRNQNSSSRSPPKKTSPTKDRKSSNDSKKDMVLIPCSRMRVFKAPNSFSYRRLLPYLMDIAKDASCAPNVITHPKIEIDTGEKPPASLSQEGNIDTPILDEVPLTIQPCLSPLEVSSNRNQEEKICLDPKVSDLNTKQADTETPINCCQDKSQVNLVLPVSQIENLMGSESHKGDVLIDELAAFNNDGTLQSASMTVEPDEAGTSLASKGSPDVSKKDTNLEALCQSSVHAERGSRIGHVEFKMDERSICVFQSKLEAVVSSRYPAGGLAKGILKRNPRGCRGICNCLHCASFRLNARKAFEFSRNQMLDTEELVLDMMKELSNLRVMLDGGNNHAMLPAEQVEEACRRACIIEDIARNRLNQMKEDVYNHCRTKSLERPRVNFSSHVEEKIIGKSRK